MAAGLAYQKLVPPPLSVDDIYSSIEDQMRELGIGHRILAQPLGLDKIKPPLPGLAAVQRRRTG